MNVNVNELRDRREALRRDEREHERRLGDIRAERVLVEAQLMQCARDEMRLTPAPRARGRGLPLEVIRSAVIDLDRFAVSELAARLRCSTVQARRELQRPEVAEIVREVRRQGQTIVYGYNNPSDPVVVEAPPVDEPAPIADPIEERGGEVVVLRSLTGHAAIKGTLGQDVEVAYTTEAPYHEAAS